MKKILVLASLLALMSSPGFAEKNHFTIRGGRDRPHSEADGDSCLNDGTVLNISYSRTIVKYNPFFSGTVHKPFFVDTGVDYFRLNYSKSDRENVNSPRTNTRDRRDNMLGIHAKPGVTLGILTLYATVNVATDFKNSYLYYGYGGGFSVRLYKNVSLDISRVRFYSENHYHKLNTMVGITYSW